MQLSHDDTPDATRAGRMSGPKRAAVVELQHQADRTPATGRPWVA